MGRKIFWVVGAILVLAFLQGVLAYDEYDYGRRYYAYPRVSGYDFDYEVYSWDGDDLKWRRDPINSWIQDGDGWREEFRRARAVDWTIDSYYDRYAMAYGRSSGDVFYYNRPTNEEVKSSNWRFKEAYSPAVYGNGKDYYSPRYDYDSGTFNWRY